MTMTMRSVLMMMVIDNDDDDDDSGDDDDDDIADGGIDVDDVNDKDHGSIKGYGAASW